MEQKVKHARVSVRSRFEPSQRCHSHLIKFFVAFVLLFSAPAHAAAELDKVRVGLSSVSATHGAMWVAEEKGLFKKHGIDPEIIVIGGGGSRGVSALIAGDIQFVTAAGDAVVSAASRGADVVMIAGILNKGVQRVMARPELKTPQDLIGKRIGVTRLGAASHLVLLMMLKKWGISPDKVRVLQVESSSAMVVNLEKGGIDAAVLTVPSNFVAEDRGYRTLADRHVTRVSSLAARPSRAVYEGFSGGHRLFQEEQE